MIEAIFFDMGYTLAWLYPSADAFSLDALRTIGVHASAKELRAADGLVEVEMSEVFSRSGADSASDRRWQDARDARLLSLLGVKNSEQQSAYSAARRVLVQDPERFRLYADTMPTLVALRRNGYRLGIVSNWGWNLPDLCTDLGLAPFVETIACSGRVGAAKPAPEVFTTALEALGVPPGRAAHVGDSYESDVAGAAGVGMTPILLQRMGHAPHPGVVTITTLCELPSLLRRL